MKLTKQITALVISTFSTVDLATCASAPSTNADLVENRDSISRQLQPLAGISTLASLMIRSLIARGYSTRTGAKAATAQI